MTLKARAVLLAVRIRMRRGETLADAISHYSRLTTEEREKIIFVIREEASSIR